VERNNQHTNVSTFFVLGDFIMAEQSKFVLFHDAAANETNRRPNLTGEYRLAGDEGAKRLALWGGVDKAGHLYARGKSNPVSTTQALRESKSVREDLEGPSGIDLKVGEAVIFENANATPENKQPKFYGYAREGEQFVRLAGWEGKNGVILGSAEPWRPGQHKDEPRPPLPSGTA
jgi:hypothetical protein